MRSATLRSLLAPVLASTPSNEPRSTSTVGDDVGRALARWARETDAGVASLHGLARDLEAFRAPKPLVRGARRAALDAIRHARMLGAMARRHEVTPEPAPADPRPAPSWDAMAIENAVDGCVRRAWELALTSYAGVHAGDLVVRETLRRIARDQAEHVAAAWKVHQWCLPRASSAARERIERGMRATISALEAEVSRMTDDDELVRCGLRPPQDVAQALLLQLRGRFWKGAPVTS
jgi:hypothetical protein